MQTSVDTPREWTFEDYLATAEDDRFEIIDGAAYSMAAPSGAHQAVVQELCRLIGNCLAGKSCVVRPAPYTVKLSNRDVVQPDVSVICDRKKLKSWGCDGAPDMVIEVRSRSTGSRDALRKFNLYRDAGVQEYWMVLPDYKEVHVYLLKDKQYVGQQYGVDDGEIQASSLDGCRIDLNEVFGGFAGEEEAAQGVLIE
ncbi:MAG: Uma2 family endonuclease [Oscillospiraceae bacterium]|jgi:Uma2 family endonuclease|nr:Uma2 family endonuclease [Oscillospiraceae bacterium]